MTGTNRRAASHEGATRLFMIFIVGFLAIAASSWLASCTSAPTVNPDGTAMTAEEQRIVRLETGLQSANRGVAALELIVIIKSDDWSPEKVVRWNLAVALARDTLTALETSFADGTLTYAELEAAAFDVLIADLKRRAAADEEPPAAE